MTNKTTIEYVRNDPKSRPLCPEAIAACLCTIEIALHRGNKDEAVAAIGRLFDEVADDQIGEETPVAALGLSMRVVNGLEAQGIFNVAHLRVAVASGWVTRIPNFARGNAQACIDKIAAIDAAGLFDDEE